MGEEEEKEYFFSNIRISTVNLFTEMCVQLDKTKLQMLNQYLKGGDLHKNLLESPFWIHYHFRPVKFVNEEREYLQRRIQKFLKG